VTSPALVAAEPGRLGRYAARARVVRTHRVCAGEDAGFVRTACLYDRAVLPRWHQDDRGDRNAHRGVHYAAPAGGYAGIRVWHGRQHWLTFVVPVAIALHRDLLRMQELSPATFALWARVESGYAQDQRTGRRCIVRPDTVASVMGCQVNTVRKCRRIARRIGLQVVIVLGRMLSAAECWAARRRGSRQRGLSTEAAFTIPSPIALRRVSDTPTRGPTAHPETHHPCPPLGGARAEQKEAAPPPHRHRGSPGRSAARRLAADLVHTVPWLHSERPGRLVPALSRFAAGRPAWTAQDVLDAVQTIRERRGLVTTLTDIQIRTRPAVVLAAFLRQLDHHDDHPRLATADPAELRCDQPECDHGWITLDQPPTSHLAGHPHVRRCPHCRPGAWPPPEDLENGSLLDGQEPPF